MSKEQYDDLRWDEIWDVETRRKIVNALDQLIDMMRFHWYCKKRDEHPDLPIEHWRDEYGDDIYRYEEMYQYKKQDEEEERARFYFGDDDDDEYY